jgi:predicted acetyltransferase
MTFDIRPVRDDELPAYIEALSTAFLDRPDVARAARELGSVWDLTRSLGAWESGQVRGTYRSWPTEITVPGGARLAASAVSAVTVLPTHRRQGILTQMVATGHATARERGEVFGVLHASEYPIYGRFGYGMAAREGVWTVQTAGLGFHPDRSGTVEMVRVDGDARDTVVRVFDAWRARQPGEIRRRDVSWEFDLALREEFWGTPWKGWLAFHRDPTGSVDGYVRYHADGTWENRQPKGVLHVDELHALTDEATATLWRFLGEIDWVATLRAERRSPSDRLPWLLVNARAASLGEVGDGIWLRMLDVPAALSARTYEREGRLVLEIADREAPGGRLRVELDGGPHGATCRPTDADPDLSLDIAALSAAYLGGSRLRHAVIATGCDEHRPGALVEADALFRTADEPWCSTFF